MSECWKYSGTCTVGERHKRSNMLCQDRMSYKCKGLRQAVSLIDGIGHTDKNTLAGEKIAGYITDYLLLQFEKIMTEDPQTIKYLLLRDVYRIIEALMNQFEMPKEEFASTIMGICIDHKRQKYCIVHLGDGIILYKNHAWKVLSYPINGRNTNQTYLTVSESALQKMKLYRGSMEDISGYAMMTDGMYDIPVRIKELGSIVDNGGRDASTEDDRSIAVLTKQ